ncbi:MAG: N-acetylmuramoyl-L-alanine amidase, partial [Paraglaciecola sp.]
AITDLYVLRETWMPAILTENGFFTNKTQAKDLMKDSVRQKIADAHVAAIMEIERKGI